MTVIYAANSESLTLLPELLVAQNIEETNLPSEGHYKEFTPQTDAPIIKEDVITLRISGTPPRTINMASYKGIGITEACRKALADKGIETPPVHLGKGDKPKL